MTNMDFEEASEKFEELNTDDVAQKRFEMFKIFEAVIQTGTESSDSEELISHLKNKNGYLYKLSQDFLLSSSTMEKGKILGKIIKYTEKR